MQVRFVTIRSNHKKVTAFARRYRIALRAHLDGAAASELSHATALGKEAVALRLETLDLAGIHEQALGADPSGQTSASAPKRLLEKAQTFFIEANVAIERTHQAAAQARDDWNHLNEALKVRTSELALSRKNLKKRKGQRQVAERTLKQHHHYHQKLWRESQAMQESLRVLARRVISAQENERGQISRQLQDEISQTLLGINVRLLTLDEKASRDTASLLREIARTRRLVGKSVAAMRRTARQVRRAS